MAKARELNAPLVKRERLFERQIAVLEFLDDRFEFGDRALEVFNGGVGHQVYQQSSPQWTQWTQRKILQGVCLCVFGVLCGRSAFSLISQSSSPFASVTRTRSPTWVSAASRS